MTASSIRTHAAHLHGMILLARIERVRSIVAADQKSPAALALRRFGFGPRAGPAGCRSFLAALQSTIAPSGR
jgi:hypothetical protein